MLILLFQKKTDIYNFKLVSNENSCVIKIENKPKKKCKTKVSEVKPQLKSSPLEPESEQEDSQYSQDHDAHIRDKLINRRISRYRQNKQNLSFDESYVNLDYSQPKRAKSKSANSLDFPDHVNTTQELDSNADKVSSETLKNC